jgi:hypothetical protein
MVKDISFYLLQDISLETCVFIYRFHNYLFFILRSILLKVLVVNYLVHIKNGNNTVFYDFYMGFLVWMQLFLTWMVSL